MYKLIIPVFIYIIINSSAIYSQNAEYKDVNCEETSKLIQENQNNPKFCILDVRTEDMYKESHIKNALVSDVYDDNFDKFLENLDKSKTYLIYCTSGVRSKEACDKMIAKGFGSIYHMYEGISEWRVKGFDTINETNTSEIK